MSNMNSHDAVLLSAPIEILRVINTEEVESISHLSGLVEKDSSNVHRIVGRLEEDGYITTKILENEGRGGGRKVPELTEKGMSVLVIANDNLE